jgi:predicted  nucleic acid-binding Zn-ribbon protein
MHPELLQIAKTAEFDQEISTIDAALTREKRSLSDAAASLDDLQKALEEHKSKIAASRQQEGRIQREIEKLQRRQRSALRVLDGSAAGADPEAADRQVSQCDKLIDERETCVLELLEHRDQLDEQKASLVAKTRAREFSLAELQRSTPVEIDRLTEVRVDVSTKRDSSFSKLPAEVQQRYLDITRRRRSPVARILDDCCSACNFKVAFQHRSDIARGLISPCRSCGRWLIIDED